MPQDSETGRQGLENGYNHADAIGALLRANRLSNSSNEFDWNGSRVVIKTGSSAVVTRAALERVDAVVYGEATAQGWTIYRVEPRAFDENSIQSQSSNHNENYRLVRRAQIREIGEPVVLADL
ncbi:hypothetical protein [Aureliella helgolandensis]|uniref:Uncharacterized protein n=1 Tax=Aureliella helgolandensis TaxID=2527968 RepID=A0A518GCN6_9BACT|nr:hypothetical protein [Aureliella helgolandensis]QDV26362.1 hypothetical protein Q31a_47360 [Aureliella helgolandensis]